MITINNDIPIEPCRLYKTKEDGTSEYIGEIKNDIAFTDIQLQIAMENSDQYFIIFKDDKYPIDASGNLSNQWPKGLFDQQMELYVKLFNIRKSRGGK